MLLISTHLFFGLLTLTAITTQLVMHIQHGYSIVNFCSYFTYTSNIFAAIVLLIGAFSLFTHRVPIMTDAIIRGISVVCMAIVGIVFSILLRDKDVGTLLPWGNIVVHYLMPVVIVLDWLYSAAKDETGTQADRVLAHRPIDLLSLLNHP